MHHRYRNFLAAGALLLASSDAEAGDAAKPFGVVELFTSQGCNSCPRADALFNEMVRKGEVIALAYHVDYWDYLGWQDTLARPENTARQYAYMRSLANRSVYTPQMVLNGRRDVNGSDQGDVNDALTALEKTGQGMKVGIEVAETDDSVIIKTEATVDPAAEAHLVLVYFDPPRAVDIARGENSGQRPIYVNAVSDIRKAGMWHGKAMEYELPKSEFDGKGGCAVLLQSNSTDGGPGAILGATIVRRP